MKSELLSVDDALAAILARVRPLGTETVSIAEAAGRVLAEPLHAAVDNPPFDASAMDGYAVRAADVRPGAELGCIGLSQAGTPFEGTIAAGKCVRIYTGAPLPEGADAVVMQEQTEAVGDTIAFGQPADPGQNIRPKGNDFFKGQELLPAGTRLNPFALALAAAGAAPIAAATGARVALLSTGDELVPPGTVPGPAQIVASNAVALTPLLAPFASSVIDAGIAPDDEKALAKALSDALDTADVVITLGGASVGDRDYVHPVLQSLGVEMGFWKIAMRPGKPLMFGTKGDTLVFGLPGNPVSALVTATVLVRPALAAIVGVALPPPRKLPLTAPIAANGARRHFLRGRLVAGEDGGPAVEPFGQTDSAHLTSLARANALIVQPENDPGRAAGVLVDVIELGFA